MKYIFLFILLSISTDVLSADGPSDWLSRLDKSLAQRDEYKHRRVERIDGLKKELAQIEKLPNKKSNDKYYELMYQLYNEYKSYCYDSAHHYAETCRDLSTRKATTSEPACMCIRHSTTCSSTTAVCAR